MRHVKGPMSFIVVLLSLWLLVTLNFGCNSSGTVDPADLRPFHRISGAAVTVCDPVRDTLNDEPVGTAAIVRLTRNEELLAGASVRLGAMMLEEADSTYRSVDSSCTVFSAAEYHLSLEEGIRLDAQVPIQFADTFRVEIAQPANRISNGNQTVSLTWTGSARSEGYVMAAVLKDSVRTGFGYSSYVTSQTTFASFPTEAFYQSGGQQPDTGWYYLYVYSFAGIPDSALAEPYLPMSLPSQLPGLSYQVRDLEARFGTVRVARHDSVQVVLLSQ
jgi:hypothetical protein